MSPIVTPARVTIRLTSEWRGTWSHDHCEICGWELRESDNEEQSVGYVDGSDWICSECYHQFIHVKPNFLNVDLEIWSASKLDGLSAEMGERVSVHHCGPAPKRHLLAVANSRSYKNPDLAIHALCKVVESLSPTGRRTWAAARKTFDVGYELRPSERSSHFSLRPDTLLRISRLGATLAVTYYRRDTKTPNFRA